MTESIGVREGHDHGHHCRCMATHRPQYLELNRHHVWPLGMGGPDIDENIEWLCPTAHYNVHELLRAMVKEDRVISHYEFTQRYEVTVSTYAQEIAALGFERWKKGSL